MLKTGNSVWDVYKKLKGERNAMGNWLPNCDPDNSVESILENIKTNIDSSFNQKTNIPMQCFPFMTPFQFKEAEIHDMLRKISPSKSSGPDEIPSKVWSLFADDIVKPLTAIFNVCVQVADLPVKWKMANIVPLPKTSPPNLTALRPISLLSMPERIFEKCLLKRIKAEFLLKFDNQQYAYRPNSSTICALIDLEDYLKRSLDNADIIACHALSIDLLKGFDRVPHDILINRMIQDDFSGFTITFVRNYLQQRSFKVKWKDKRSVVSMIPSGIPQGSSLGPLLFGYFISDLTISNTSGVQDSMIFKYADDIFISCTIRRGDSSSNLAKTYESIIDWTQKSYMDIKEEKCQQMLFTLSRSFSPEQFALPNIPVVNSMKILGITFECNLKWNLHFNHICKRASSRLYVIRQLRDYLPTSELTLVYQNCIRSLLEYGAPLFSDLPRKLVIKLEQIQRRAHFVICNTHDCECLNFVPLEYRRTILSFKLFESILGNNEHILHHLLPSVMPYSGKFRIPISRTALRSKCFIIQMSRLHNSNFTL